MIPFTQIVLRSVALAVGIALAAHAGRRPTRRGRAAWQSLGVATGLAPCFVVAVEAGVAPAHRSEVALIIGGHAFGLLVGCVALAVGLRGRRVGDHDHCRRCGFDLFGRPESTCVCGECGASLDSPHAIVAGQRRRRPRFVAVGTFALIVTLGYAASFSRDVYRRATTADLAPYKPAGWLIDDMWANAKGMRRSDASAEIQRRIAGGTMGRAAVGRLVARLLDDPLSTPRMPGVDESRTHAMFTVEAAWANDQVDEAVARRAMRAALDCTMLVAPAASRGRTLRYWIATGDYRLMRREYGRGEYGPPTTVTITRRAATLDGRPLPTPTWSTLIARDEWPALRAFGNAFDLAGFDADGAATLAVRFTATLTLALPGRPVLVETRDVVLTGTTTLVDPTTMTCPQVAAAPPVPSTAGPTPLLSLATATSFEKAEGRVLRVIAPPAGAILADVVLTTGGAERTLGTIYANAGEQDAVPFEEVPTGPYTIELRSVPARGADLFRPVPTFGVSIVVPSSSISDTTAE